MDYKPVSQIELAPNDIKQLDVNIINKQNEFTIYLQQSGKPQQQLVCSPEWTLDEIRAIAFTEDLSAGKSIRFLYLGRVLENNSSLESLGVNSNDVLQVQIADPKISSASTDLKDDPTQSTEYTNDFNLPSLQELDGTLLNSDFTTRSDDVLHQRNRGNHWSLFFIGLILGIIFRELTLFWFCISNLPKSQKLGILTGVFLGMIYDVIFGDPRTKKK